MATFDYTPLNPPLDATNYPDLFTTFFGDISTDLTSVSDATDVNTAYRLGIPVTGFSLNDGAALLLGDIDDTSISHTGTNTDINHSGTGDLRLINTSNIVAIGDTYVNLLDNINLNFGTTLQGTIRYDLANTELDITSTNIHLTGIVEITGATTITGATNITGDLLLTTGGITLEDDETITFGTGLDATIHYNSAVNTVDFNTSSLGYRLSTTTSNGIVVGTSVTLYYLTTNRLATTSTGIIVTGDINLNGTTLTSTATELNQLAGRTLASTDDVIDNFPTGTLVLFANTSAPTGWVTQTTHNNKALRVVSSGGGASGGATVFNSVFGSGKVAGNTTLSSSQSGVPAHTHIERQHTGGGGITDIINAAGGIGTGYNSVLSTVANTAASAVSSHNHTLSLDIQYVDIIIGRKS